ncbi:hypothetical protein LRS10_22185 [Phenylobacterium sp. J426]|uniref:hypothetical protein n=1 Tax=Phenylobacterium sp. J426 TaxID=2898439 RepID=UPI00215122A3|nr:hypothetical protein [Phenylobacterium sp. J426]MCR5876619.1 hypothetical protein [Phenylobacterium sp. J426]
MRGAWKAWLVCLSCSLVGVTGLVLAVEAFVTGDVERLGIVRAPGAALIPYWIFVLGGALVALVLSIAGVVGLWNLLLPVSRDPRLNDDNRGTRSSDSQTSSCAKD